MNRIQTAIDRLTPRMANLANQPEIEAKTRLTVQEHAHFQTLKSAYMGVSITSEEAQTLYQLLGPTVTHANAQPLAVRAVLLATYAQLLTLSGQALSA